MKKKTYIIVLSVLLLTYGCTKEDNVVENNLGIQEDADEYIETANSGLGYAQEDTDEYIEFTNSESVLVSDETKMEALEDRNYDIIDSVMGKEFGTFITEDEKFWVYAYHVDENTDQVDDSAYILTDSHEHIYSELPRTIVPEGFYISPLSEDALAIYSSYDSESGYIIDSTGNNITSEYINEDERIVRVERDDNGVHIFTILTEENYSEQNIIFKVYDDKKNCVISFTRNEIEDKYGIEWTGNADSLGISYLGGNIYCVNEKTLSNSIKNCIDVLGQQFLYLDTTRKKVFFMTLPEGYAGISDGKYILRQNRISGECVIDIDNETFEPLNWISYRDGYTQPYSNLWNGKFITKPSDWDLFAIYDIQGNLVCDLENDAVNVTACTNFYDGYALIEITNEGGHHL